MAYDRKQKKSKDKNNENIKWKFAFTYRNVAPHWYIIQEKYPEYFDEMKAKIKKYGEERTFCALSGILFNKYYIEGGYKYWIMDDVLNRAKADGPQATFQYIKKYGTDKPTVEYLLGLLKKKKRKESPSL
ncbi:MAG: hypothetical protein QXT45_02755 [Candidatus Bilamarchaeaceae archaeon]